MGEPKIAEKQWSKELEKNLYERWIHEKRYAFNAHTNRPVYSIDTPPPYVNSPVHIGQATTYVLMDMFARYRRMIGQEVLFPLGLDRNGLPIELAAEKEFKVRLHSIAREEAIGYCKKILERSSLASVKTFMELGISFNSWEQGSNPGDLYYTDSAEYRALTQNTFIDLWSKGLIYEDERINNYCPGCRTTLADAEVDYEELPTDFNDIIFKVEETGEELTIATTRPELVCTCAMVIYHPDDARYTHLAGKHAITPLFNKKVPLQAHTLANPEKGTGLVMMCSAGDTSDIRFFRDMKLTPVIAISADGTMNEHAGFLKGLHVKKARAHMIDELKKNGLLIAQRKIFHRTPICERSKDPIEFISMKELYLKQVDMKETMTELAHAMNFYAPESRQILLDWINSVSIDWPISRRRYYATEIPLWHCNECGRALLGRKGKYHQPWREAYEGPCACGSTNITPDSRVFDTWFDSSISPLYILMYERDETFYKKHAPCSLRPQGKEIVRTWLYYTVLKDYLLTGKLIFNDVWINYHIVDDKGKKMSKSKGNIIDPQEVITRYGAEPFRLWAAIEGNLERTDFRCSFERIEGANKSLTKLWNVARFVSAFETSGDDTEFTPLDLWIRSEMDALITLCAERYSQYDFHNPAIQLKHFLWETFASHYLELVKNRAYNKNAEFSPAEQNGAVRTLTYCLENLLLLLAPITPFITQHVYEGLTGKDIHAQQFPTPSSKPEKHHGLRKEDIVAMNSTIWKRKQESGKSLKEPVRRATLPASLKNAEKDIKGTHNIQELTWGEELAVEL